MSFTSHIVPIGEGFDPTPQTEVDPIYVSSASNLPSKSIGEEGSSDDASKLFPDRFVDQAKEAEENSLALERVKKKQKRLKVKQKKESNEKLEEMPDEIL